ncbi:MAG: hypothetical protein EPO68_09545 [Planctomycetota bacterium]|nr:MAG: hypothetical protein EPO68_09545 [Planctomycetota bacterium]
MRYSRITLTSAACGAWFVLFSPFASTQSTCGVPAAVETLGTSCGVTLSGGLPVLGSTVQLDARSNLGNAPTWFFISPAGNPPTLIESCNLFVDLGKLTLLATTSTDPGGDCHCPVNVPTRVELCGRQFNVQALVGSQAGPLSFGALSNGLKFTLGS